MSFPIAVTLEDFTATATSEGNVVRLALKGNADMRAQPAVAELVPKLHEEARRLGASEVVVSFRELAFMNSHCFKSFVTWLCRVDKAPPEERYVIRFESNQRAHWQRRSLEALARVAVDVVRVEYVAA